MSTAFKNITVPNKTNNLTKHIFVDPNTNQEIGTVSNLIFKEKDYIHTYIIINTSGIPNGTLTLVDENNNPLYSPYNTDGYAQKTLCQITIKQSNAIPLPANYTNNSYTHFTGSKNWKLYYHDPNGIYMDKYIQLPTINIEDFKIWDAPTSLYSNENPMIIHVRTYVNTIQEDLYYQLENTSIVFYIDNNGDITINTPLFFSVGNHSHTLRKNGSVSNTQLLQYTVLEPIYYVSTINWFDTNYNDLLIETIAFNKINNNELVQNVTMSNNDLTITKENIVDQYDSKISNSVQSIEMDSNKDLIITK